MSEEKSPYIIISDETLKETDKEKDISKISHESYWFEILLEDEEYDNAIAKLN